MRLRMGGLRALQTDTAEGPARFAAGRAPQIEKYPEIHDLARKITLAGNACDQRQRTSVIETGANEGGRGMNRSVCAGSRFSTSKFQRPPAGASPSISNPVRRRISR